MTIVQLLLFGLVFLIISAVCVLNIQSVDIERMSEDTKLNSEAAKEYKEAVRRCKSASAKPASQELFEYRPKEVHLRGIQFLDAFVRMGTTPKREWSLFLLSYHADKRYNYLADLRCSFEGTDLTTPLHLVAQPRTKAFGGEGVLTCRIPPILNHLEGVLLVKVRSGNSIDMMICAAVVPAGGPKYRHSLTSMIRNEEASVVEWIEHHRNVGFEHFYIYDNGSDDATLKTLRHYTEAKVVSLVHWNYQLGGPDNNRGQRVQINHALWMFGPQVEWMGLMDMDEFFLPGSDGQNSNSDSASVGWKSKLAAHAGKSGKQVKLPLFVTQKRKSCGPLRLRDCNFRRSDGGGSNANPKTLVFTGYQLSKFTVTNPHDGQEVLDVGEIAHFANKYGCTGQPSSRCVEDRSIKLKWGDAAAARIKRQQKCAKTSAPAVCLI